MRIEVWTRRGPRPGDQPVKIGDFECDFVPRQGDSVNIRSGWCAFTVTQSILNLPGNSVEIEIPWVDLDAGDDDD